MVSFIYLRNAHYNKYVINKTSEGGNNEHVTWQNDSVPNGTVVTMHTERFKIKNSIFCPGILIMKFNETHYFSNSFHKILYVFHTSPLSERFKIKNSIFCPGILIMKFNETHYFSNLFHKILYVFHTSPLSNISSISTLYRR